MKGGFIMIKILIGVVVLTIAVIGAFLFLDPNSGLNATGGAQVTEVSDANTISITVEGEVYKPGTYTLEDGSTFKDLISAAGGATSNADDRAYYESAIVSNGMTYYIASKYDANDICNSQSITKVNLNTDDAATLSSINGISSTVGEAIVSYRASKGLFSTIEQIQEVYGVGSATYKKVRDYVILHE